MNTKDKEALKARYSRFDAVAPGEPVSYFGTRLHLACELDDVTEVKRLLADPAYDPNAFNVFDTCLHSAAWAGSVGAIKLLLKDSRVSANTLNANGETALIRAAEGQHVDAVKILLKHTVADHVSNHGANALMSACLEGNTEVAKLLLTKIDPLATNNEGETALMFAAKSGDSKCINLLLPISDIQAVDDQGENALMKAAAWGNSKAVKQLMKHIPIDQVNNAGLDAIGVARKSLDDRWSENGKGIKAVIDFLTAYKQSAEGVQNTPETTADKKAMAGLDDPSWNVPNPFAPMLPFFFAKNAFKKEHDWMVSVDMGKEGVSVDLRCEDNDERNLKAFVKFGTLFLVYGNNRCTHSFLDEKVNGEDAYYLMEAADSDVFLEKIGIKEFLDELKGPATGVEQTSKPNAKRKKLKA